MYNPELRSDFWDEMDRRDRELKRCTASNVTVPHGDHTRAPGTDKPEAYVTAMVDSSFSR